MNFTEFYKEFLIEYNTTETDYDGSVMYHFDDSSISVSPEDLIKLLTDEEVEEMFARAAWDSDDNYERIYEITESDRTAREKVEALSDEDLLQKVFDDVALDQAEGSDGFEEIIRDLYDVWSEENREGIRELRMVTGMTQREFAEYFDIPQRTVEGWETGRRQPPVYVEKLIAYKIEKEGLKMAKMISLDNGSSYLTAAEAMPEIERRDLWDQVAQLMDDEIRERVHGELAPCTEQEFLQRYLELANDDLIVG